MRKTKIFLFLFFLFTFSVCAKAQTIVGDGTMSNGGALSSGGGNSHFSSINGGLIFSSPTQTLDYRMDSGILARFEPNSDKIEFVNASTSVFLGTPVSIDIKTTVQTLRQVAYRASSGTAPGEYEPFTLVWSSGGVGGGGTLSSGTFTVDGSTLPFTYGLNYIQWYAQNTDGDWGMYLTAVYASTGISAAFIKPSQGAYLSRQPEIEIYIETNQKFKLSDVKVSLYSGDPSSGSLISSSVYTSSDSTEYETYTIKFRYNDAANPLGLNQTYTLKVEVTDSDSKTASSEVTFHTVRNEGLYRFLPYPSPYNPNSGQPFKIKYAIGEDSKVDINIYDRAGKLVSRVVPSVNQIAGEYVVDWNARNYAGDSLANGVYICEIKVKGSSEQRKYISFAILRK